LTLSLAGHTYDLGEGDAVHFDSRLPHRVIARGNADAEVLLIASPLALERSSAALPAIAAPARASRQKTNRTSDLYTLS
jgi:quercetin dioxygenase-like cupin family protein